MKKGVQEYQIWIYKKYHYSAYFFDKWAYITTENYLL